MRALLPDHSLGYERGDNFRVSDSTGQSVPAFGSSPGWSCGDFGDAVGESVEATQRTLGLASDELSGPMPFSLAVPMRQEITAALFPPTRSDFAVSGPPAPQNIGKGSGNSKTKINQHACSGRSGHCKQCVHVFLQTCH